ncbi:hypothetical protein ACIL2K_004353 [Vibrio vulnificus]|nr:hypothetical protein [Vibrio vulnificus]EKZ9057762.1 hypothetical protein [Vibrio vulnificus]
MNKFDKPLYWVHEKTKNSYLSKWQCFGVLMLLSIGITILVSLTNIYSIAPVLLVVPTALLPMSFSLALIRFKCEYSGSGSFNIPLAYFFGNSIGVRVERGLAWLFSVYVSLCLYWLLIAAIIILLSVPPMAIFSVINS